jgi:hypothetical protein
MLGPLISLGSSKSNPEGHFRSPGHAVRCMDGDFGRPVRAGVVTRNRLNTLMIIDVSNTGQDKTVLSAAHVEL